MSPAWRTVLGRAAVSGLRAAVRSATRTATRSAPRGGRGPTSVGRSSTPPAAAYPGDFTGRATVSYAPVPDGRADPGEVVWGWVPFEEDAARGKDRPSLVVGRDGRWVLALMLTSKDHDQPGRARHDADEGTRWFDLGSGPWDRRGRESEVRLDRVLRLDPDAIRREGGRLDRERFDQVAERLCRLHGWSR